MKTSDIENLMRRAPILEPPSGLKEQLIGQVQLPSVCSGPATVSTPGDFSVWIRRWWPALVPAAISVVCAAVIAAQHMEIQGLKAKIKILSQPTPADVPAPPTSTSPAPTNSLLDPMVAEQQEIANLKTLIARLRDEAARLEQMAVENAKLRAQLAAPLPATVKAEELGALESAQQTAWRLRCVSNLKNLGLAVRVWAVDNSNSFPPDVPSMSNEISSPMVCVCPADQARRPASSWQEFTPANCTYEFLAPDGSESEHERVLFRCPIHGMVTLCDGSVPSSDRLPPDCLEYRNGKLFYRRKSSSAVPSSSLNATEARAIRSDTPQAPVPSIPKP